ncbi:MAG TPA: hypothetical protein VNG35_10555 [Gemmatimonadales bacterium]|nr:hypothetical protein [Gemmatimonadales bacterium]
MGVFVNGKWREDLADPNPNGGSNLSSVPAPSKPTSGSNAVATVPPPAAMPSTLGNTNDQSVRADLRKQGYFIDASGIYAPGAGQRVGDTFSGAQASQNVAPSQTQIPIINGVPISPSNGSTGPQTGAIMYRSDPQYAQYFGRGTPGYTATSQTYNATPTGPEAGQQSLAAWNTAQGNQVDQTGAPIARPASVTSSQAPTTNGAVIPPSVTDPVATAAAAAAGAAPNADRFAAGVSAPNESGTGYGPYATTEPPKLTVQGRYSENGQIIEKSVDQFGNPYYNTVGNAPSAVSPPAQPAAPDQAPAAAPAVPAHQDPAALANPASVTPTGLSVHTFIGTDGKPQTVNLSDSDFQMALQDQQNAQAAVRQATQFSQGIEQGKVDILRATQVGQQAYNDALVKSQSVQNAQTALRDAMQNEISKQTEQINAAAQVANQQYQQGQLEQQRSATAQTNALELQKLEAQRQAQAQTTSTEREKIDLSRQQGRGRRLPQVRYA